MELSKFCGLPQGSLDVRLGPEDPEAASEPPRAARKCSSQNALCRPHPTAITLTGSRKTFSDRAATSYGSDDHEQSRGSTQLRLHAAEGVCLTLDRGYSADPSVMVNASESADTSSESISSWPT
jgi:hypothetical protein